MLLKEFNENAQRLGLCPGESVLAAVSGGVDSVVMLHLLIHAGMYPVLAHCNFRLRGSESDEDERFCKMLAKEHGLLCFARKFNTLRESQSRGLAIQETARILRYQWCLELAQKYYIEHIAVGHNAEDVTETFFINLMRGSGLQGLCSIPEKNKSIVRPLLFASRSDIEQYARKHGLAFRNDSSNDSDKYLRNQIRHRLIPMMEEIRPGSSQKVCKTAEILGTYRDYVNWCLEEQHNNIVAYKDNQMIIKRADLKKHPFPALVLHHVLTPLGFTADAVKRLADSFSMQTGKQFISNAFILTVNSRHLVVAVRKKVDITELIIRGEGDYVWNGFRFIVTPIVCKNPSGGKDYVVIDNRVAAMPWIVRSRRQGDRMQPFGMEGSRKVSDMLTDAKVAANLKPKWPVVLQGSDIIWLPGVRSAQQIAVKKWSGKAWKIECIQP
jgi:tRNA(Ile)-lysidine synthase